MPGELLLLAALGGPLDADRFTLGVPAEVDLVGLAAGVRPELRWRPVRADGATELRVATGLMVGPELAFVPASLSLRGRWFPKAPVHPVGGLGTELQLFFSGGHPVVARQAVIFELGVDVDVSERAAVGLVLEPGFAPKPLIGFGAAVRLGVSWDLGG